MSSSTEMRVSVGTGQHRDESHVNWAEECTFVESEQMPGAWHDSGRSRQQLCAFETGDPGSGWLGGGYSWIVHPYLRM